MRGTTPEQGSDQAPARAPAQLVWHRQDFSVAFEFPVVFTCGVFAPDNPVLVDVLCRKEPDRQHRCIVFLDEGVLSVRPSMVEEIRAYARHHGNRMALVADPVPVPGGERIKIDLHFVEAMQRQLFEHRIDRHSYAIASLKEQSAG